MDFKAPNVKGPRFRNESKAVIDKAFLAKFKKRFPEYRLIKSDMFKAIITTLHKDLVQGIIDNRDGIELPEGLGFLFIANCQKSKKENIDFRASASAGKKVLHQNWDSDNRLMKIIFSNKAANYRLSNKQVWTFRLVKTNRQLVSIAYRKQWSKYHIIPNEKGIHLRFKRRTKRMQIKTRKASVPSDYNEFKMD